MANALPISRLINVDVNLSPAAAQMQNISTLLILGASTVIDVSERYRVYNSIDAVAADFGTSADEYYSALLWFEQAPQPNEVLIGRWAQDATTSVLRGAANTAVLATLIGNTSPAFDITIDGTLYTIVPGSFAAQTNFNGIAALISTALNTAAAGCACVYNANFGRFEITGTTGSGKTLSFASTPTVGTHNDVSTELGLAASNSGAYLVDGVADELPVNCVTLFDNNYGQRFYAVTFATAPASNTEAPHDPATINPNHLAVASYIEATNTKHIYGISTQEAGVLVSTDVSNIAYLTKAAKYHRTAVQYSSINKYSVASLFGRILTVNYNGNNTVITLMYKQEPGIVPETLNATQITSLESFNCNVFVSYNNDTAIIEKGVVSTGDFLDIITGTDWLALQIQNEVFNLLYTSTTKIPQTDPGTHLIVTTIENVCSQAVRNGLLAPGKWGAGGFGTLQQNDLLPKGFYVYAPPVADQFAADRAARKSVPIQVAAKLAGAVHTVDITINVNR